MTDLLGFDCSNYDDLATLLATIPEAERVVVRCSLERESLSAITRQQCQLVRDSGLGLDVYVWAYPMLDDPETLAGRAVALVGEYAPDLYWIDCEDTGSSYPDAARNVAWLQRAVAGFQALRLRVGIYTGHWFWTSPQMGNPTVFSDLPLWNATDAKVPDRSIGWPYGGWQPPYPVVQYDLSGPDRDCFDGALYEGGTENGDEDMTDSQRAIVDDEIIRNVNLALGNIGTALAAPKLPAAARTALQTARDNLAAGALPAAQTLSRNEG